MQRAEWEGRPVAEWAQAWGIPRLEVHRALGSTNDRALALAAVDAPAYTTVIADEQTEGRGRSGNRWLAPPGSGLLISVILPETAGLSPALPLVVGLAAARAVEAEAPDVHVGLKWPNDLFVRGRKLGGVLCERRGRAAVVAGLGLNTATPSGGYPGELNAVSVEEASGTPASRAALAGRLLETLRDLFRRPWAEVSPHLHAEFARRDVLAGTQVLTSEGPGEAVGIDAKGALVIRKTDGTEVPVISGSVTPA